MAWPQQDLTKGVNNPKFLQNTTKIKIDISLIFYVCNNTTIKLLFCKHIIHLQNHSTFHIVSKNPTTK
jgi:hypothetical protein